MNEFKRHLVLAGGGLAASLIALRVTARHPDTRVSLVEAGPALGGNHTWSFHAGDLSEAQHAFLEPLVVHKWSQQEVRFPRYTRRLGAGYFSMTSESLREHMADQPGMDIRTNSAVSAVGADYVEISGQQRLTGDAVVDARGPGDAPGMILGFQKFFGREVRTAAPHGVEFPVIMDATVSQADGYRFIYLLPFDETTLLIEDTRYSDGAGLADEELAAAIDTYAEQQGWRIVDRLRDERGVLPILLAGEFERFWPADDPVARAGLRAGLFHPTTGYSLPQALTLADEIADRWPMDGKSLGRLTRSHAHRFFNETGHFRLLNRMLFRAGQPEQRYRVLERFYTLSDPLITNFYAAKLKLRNKMRILVGNPPVPFFRALALVREESFIRREQ